MVNLSDVRKSNSALETSSSLVAVFAGGTSGIGEATVKALAANAKDPKVYIIGRNEARASRIIEECVQSCPGGSFTFVKADLSLLKNVDMMCEEIKKREETSKLDLLFMSQGYITLEGRKETSEGLDTLMALRYYSRMRLLHNFLPLLLRSPSPRVVSILAAGHEGKLYPSDFSLRSHYGLFNNISHVAFMTTFFFEGIVARNPSVSCVHVYPGLVKTAEFENGLFPDWLKWFFKWIFLPLISPFCIPVQECGERNLFHSTSAKYPSPRRSDENSPTMIALSEGVEVASGVDGERGSGVYAVDWNGEVFKKTENVYRGWREKGMNEKVWEHTMKAFEVIKRGEVFVE